MSRIEGVRAKAVQWVLGFLVLCAIASAQSERATQDRIIHYWLLEPDSHQFRISHDFTENPKRNNVGDDVDELDVAVAEIFEVVLVMPDFVRPDPLFIDEKPSLFDVRDFREPARWNTEQRTHPIFDHQPRINSRG